MVCERCVIVRCCVLGQCREIIELDSLWSGGVAAPLYPLHSLRPCNYPYSGAITLLTELEPNLASRRYNFSMEMAIV
jgi:hypothetical protein